MSMRLTADLAVIYSDAKGQVQSAYATMMMGGLKTLGFIAGMSPTNMFENRDGRWEMADTKEKLLEIVPIRRERGAITRWTKQLAAEKETKKPAPKKTRKKTAV